MKFLCMACDRPMKLKDAVGPDRGSVALVYSCSECEAEFAMLTNPHETQVVTSLGIDIRPNREADGNAVEGASRCPFTGMLQEMGADSHSEPADGEETGAIRWTAQARERLAGIPEFVRPMAKSGIEKYARDQGYSEIDETVLAEARSHFGM